MMVSRDEHVEKIDENGTYKNYLPPSLTSFLHFYISFLLEVLVIASRFPTCSFSLPSISHLTCMVHVRKVSLLRGPDESNKNYHLMSGDYLLSLRPEYHQRCQPMAPCNPHTVFPDDQTSFSFLFLLQNPPKPR